MTILNRLYTSAFLLQVTEELHRVALMQGGFELNVGKRFVLWWNHVVS